MHLDSLSFVYLFLPLTIAVCLISPMRWRPAVLLAFSALFYWWLEGENLLLLAGIVLFDYLMGRLLERASKMPRLRRGIMICSAVKSVAIFLLYGALGPVWGAHFPLGLGVVALTSCGYVIDCYFGYTYAERNLPALALMNLFFPRLYAGPLVYHNKLMPQVKGMRMTLERAGEGGRLFLVGLGKKVIIGDAVYELYGSLRGMPTLNMTALSVWTMVVTLAFSVYFIFSGYCDMAKGIGLVFGVELPDNFHYPYQATSVNDFFARFNIAVNRYIRRYVYINLGGAQGSVISGVFNILLVTILMGLWFGISLNLLLWGVYFAAFVIFERYFLSRYMDGIPTLFRWLYTTLVVLVSFAFFSGGTPGQSLGFLKMMFGVGGFATLESSKSVLYLLASHYLVLILAAVSSTGLVGWFAGLWKKHLPRTYGVASAVFTAALLVVTTAYLL